MRWFDRDPVGRAFVEECEAFLEGRYAELCEGRGEPRPAWSWLNLPAHGAEVNLRAAAAEPPIGERWRRARAFVAGEVVDLIDARRLSLEEMQRRVLVPFEFRAMASCRDCRDAVPLGHLVNDLLEALSNERARLRA